MRTACTWLFSGSVVMRDGVGVLCGSMVGCGGFHTKQKGNVCSAETFTLSYYALAIATLPSCPASGYRKQETCFILSPTKAVKPFLGLLYAI